MAIRLIFSFFRKCTMPDLPDFNKILVIQTAFIGDVVLATPLLEELHRVFPMARIDFMLRKGNEGIFQNHPFIGRVLIWNKKKRKHLNLVNLLLEVRREQYDLVLNLQRYFSTGLITGFSDGKTRVCFDKNPLAFLANKVVPHEINETGEIIHEVSRNLRLIALWTTTSFSKPKIYPTKADFERVQVIGKYITISPASVWFTKQFPKVKWLEFMDRVGGDTTIFLLGGPNDLKLCNELKQTTEHPKTIVKAGVYSFLESAALMKNALMNYTNDSAPLHFASAMNAPVTAIFCATIPAFGFGPLSTNSFVVETVEKLPCRPCGLHGKNACPEGHFRCTEIDVVQLLEKLG
jgi:ADP-heptose:LPS heptosyltransferase